MVKNANKIISKTMQTVNINYIVFVFLLKNNYLLMFLLILYVKLH